VQIDMKGLAAKKHDTFADIDVTDLEETVALPVMMIPGGEAANSPIPSELLQHMERLIELGESIEDKLAKIAKSLETSPPSSPRKRKTVKSTKKSPPSSPRKRKTVKSTARSTRKKTAKS
jgi:hypothetical protein